MGLLVEAERVSKFYGTTRALRDASMALSSGEVVALVGANGSGKTTLLRVLSTLTRPTRGVVRYPGLGGSPETARERLGFVSHEAMAYADLSARENVELAAELAGSDSRSHAESILRDLEIGAFEDRPLRTCSRGQRQRVAIARAFVLSPQLLLLDEPTTGLDESGVAILCGLIGRARDQGAGIALVVHDRAWAEGLITREIAFAQGRIVAPLEVASE